MKTIPENIYHVAARLMSPYDIGKGKDKLRESARIAEKYVSIIWIAIFFVAVISTICFFTFSVLAIIEPHRNLKFGLTPIFPAIISFVIFVASIFTPDIIQYYNPLKSWTKLPNECNATELEPLFEALKKGTWEAVNSKGEYIPEYLFASEWRIFLVAGPSYRHRRMWVRHFLSRAYTEDIMVRPLMNTDISWAYESEILLYSNDNDNESNDEVDVISDYFLWQLNKKHFQAVIKNTPSLQSDNVEALKVKFALSWFYNKFQKLGSLQNQKWKYMLGDFAKDLKNYANKLRQSNAINQIEYNALSSIGLTGKEDDKWLRELRRGRYISICRKVEEAYSSIKTA